MFDEDVLREQLDANHGRLLGLIRLYTVTLDYGDRLEIVRLAGAA